jgi:protein-tyrosine sulfotransferase
MKKPFFIIGSGRSGSTFLYSMLKDHPDVALTNEAKVLDVLCLGYEYGTLPAGEISSSRGLRGVIHHDAIALFSDLYKKHARQILEEFYGSYFDKPFTHWGDKLPDAACALEMRQLFSDVKYIVLLRDPRDVMCSYRMHDARSVVTPERWPSVGLKDRCESWVSIYLYILSHLDVTEYLVVKYESLVTNPEDALANVLNILCLAEFDTASARREAELMFGTHGTSRSVESSIGRWRTELESNEITMITDVCGEIMAQFGYK